MPELPDLVYIQKHLADRLTGATVTGCEIRQPVIIRSSVDQPPAVLFRGRTVTSVGIRGPFIILRLSPPLELVINLMLAGRLRLQHARDRPAGYLCVALAFADGSRLNLCDEKKMAKLYIVVPGNYAHIPKFDQQGVDILSSDFTPARFRELARANRRKQVRVFINDHRLLSAIGNAYADEILFEARIHPKTFVSSLDPAHVDRLYNAIRSVIAWGIAEVQNAGQPIDVKVRGHMKIRNRKGEPCPRCGTTIRREGVRGHDVFFCPTCQPASRRLFIDWRTA